MSIVKNGEYVAKEIFDGRNSEWFDNLQGRGWDDVYDTLPAEHGVYEKSPEDVLKDAKEQYYYGFRYIKVKDIFKWLRDYKPWIDAGWALPFDKWNYDFRGIVPEEGFPHYLPEDDAQGYIFIEYEKPYDCGKWLYNFIRKTYDEDKKDEYKNIPEDDYLIYYFDC